MRAQPSEQSDVNLFRWGVGVVIGALLAECVIGVIFFNVHAATSRSETLRFVPWVGLVAAGFFAAVVNIARHKQGAETLHGAEFESTTRLFNDALRDVLDHSRAPIAWQQLMNLVESSEAGPRRLRMLDRAITVCWSIVGSEPGAEGRDAAINAFSTLLELRNKLFDERADAELVISSSGMNLEDVTLPALRVPPKVTLDLSGATVAGLRLIGAQIHGKVTSARGLTLLGDLNFNRASLCGSGQTVGKIELKGIESGDSVSGTPKLVLANVTGSSTVRSACCIAANPDRSQELLFDVNGRHENVDIEISGTFSNVSAVDMGNSTWTDSNFTVLAGSEVSVAGAEVSLASKSKLTIKGEGPQPVVGFPTAISALSDSSICIDHAYIAESTFDGWRVGEDSSLTLKGCTFSEDPHGGPALLSKAALKIEDATCEGPLRLLPSVDGSLNRVEVTGNYMTAADELTLEVYPRRAIASEADSLRLELNLRDLDPAFTELDTGAGRHLPIVGGRVKEAFDIQAVAEEVAAHA